MSTRATTEWTTVAVTPLPSGWQNEYTNEDPGQPPLTTPCPALLLQEARSRYVTTRDEEGNHVSSRDIALDLPYGTRVVFADSDDCGHLDPAIDSGNYERTVYRSPGADE